MSESTDSLDDGRNSVPPERVRFRGQNQVAELLIVQSSLGNGGRGVSCPSGRASALPQGQYKISSLRVFRRYLHSAVILLVVGLSLLPVQSVVQVTSTSKPSLNDGGSAAELGRISNQLQAIPTNQMWAGEASSRSLQTTEEGTQARNGVIDASPVRQGFPVIGIDTLPHGKHRQKPRKLKCSAGPFILNLWASDSPVEVGEVRTKAAEHRGRDGGFQKLSAHENDEAAEGCTLSGSWWTHATPERHFLSIGPENGDDMWGSGLSIEFRDAGRRARACCRDFGETAASPRELQQTANDEQEVPGGYRPSGGLLTIAQSVCAAAKAQSVWEKPGLLLSLSKSVLSHGSSLREALPSAIFQNREREMPTVRRAGFALLDWVVAPPRGLASFSCAAEDYRQRRGVRDAAGIRLVSRVPLSAPSIQAESSEGPPSSPSAAVHALRALSTPVTLSGESEKGSAASDSSTAPDPESLSFSPSPVSAPHSSPPSDGLETGIAPAMKIYSGALAAYLVPLVSGCVLLIVVPFILLVSCGVCCCSDQDDGEGRACALACLCKPCVRIWCHPYRSASSGGHLASFHRPDQSFTIRIATSDGSGTLHEDDARSSQPPHPVYREGRTSICSFSQREDGAVEQGGYPALWAPRPAVRITGLIVLVLTFLGVVLCILLTFIFSVQLRQAVDDTECAATEFFVQLVHGSSVDVIHLVPSNGPSSLQPDSPPPGSQENQPSFIDTAESSSQPASTGGARDLLSWLPPKSQVPGLYTIPSDPRFRSVPSLSPLTSNAAPEGESAEGGAVRPPFLSDHFLEDVTSLVADDVGEGSDARMLVRYAASLFRRNERAATGWGLGPTGEALLGTRKSWQEKSENGKAPSREEQLDIESPEEFGKAEGMQSRQLSSSFVSRYVPSWLLSSGVPVPAFSEGEREHEMTRDMHLLPAGGALAVHGNTASSRLSSEPPLSFSGSSRRLSAASALQHQENGHDREKVRKGPPQGQHWMTELLRKLLRWGGLFRRGRKKKRTQGGKVKTVGDAPALTINSELIQSAGYGAQLPEGTANARQHTPGASDAPTESPGHPVPSRDAVGSSPSTSDTTSTAPPSLGGRELETHSQPQLENGQPDLRTQDGVNARDTVSAPFRAASSSGWEPAGLHPSGTADAVDDGVGSSRPRTFVLSDEGMPLEPERSPVESLEAGRSLRVPAETPSADTREGRLKAGADAGGSPLAPAYSNAVEAASTGAGGDAAPSAPLPSEASDRTRPATSHSSEKAHAPAEPGGASSPTKSAGGPLSFGGKGVEGSGMREPPAGPVNLVAAVRELAAKLPGAGQQTRASEKHEKGVIPVEPLHGSRDGFGDPLKDMRGNSRSDGGHQEAREGNWRQDGEEPGQEGEFAGLKPALSILMRVRDLSDGRSPHGLQQVLLDAATSGLDADTQIEILHEHLRNAHNMLTDAENSNPGPAGEGFHRNLASVVASPTFELIISRLSLLREQVRELKEHSQAAILAVKDLSSRIHDIMGGYAFGKFDDAVEEGSDRVQGGILSLDTIKTPVTVVLYVLAGLTGCLLGIMIVYLAFLCCWWRPGTSKFSTVPSLVFWPIALLLAVFGFIVGGALLVVAVVQVDACLFISREVQHPGVLEALAVSCGSQSGNLEDVGNAAAIAKACFANTSDEAPVERNLTQALGLQDVSTSVGEFEQYLRRFDSVDLQMLDRLLFGTSLAHAVLQDTAWVFFLNSYALSSQGSSSRTNTYLPVLYSGLQDKARTFHSPFDVPTARLVGPPGLTREDLLTLPPSGAAASGFLQYINSELKRLQAKRSRANEGDSTPAASTEAERAPGASASAPQTPMLPASSDFSDKSVGGEFLLYGLLDVEEYIQPFYFEALHRGETGRDTRYRIDDFFSVDAPEIRAEIARLKPDPEERIKYENALWLAALKQRLRTGGAQSGGHSTPPDSGPEAEASEVRDDAQTHATSPSSPTATANAAKPPNPLPLPFRCSEKKRLSGQELERARTQEVNRTKRLREGLDGSDPSVWKDEAQAEGAPRILLPYGRKWRRCDYDQWTDLVESQEPVDLLSQTQALYDRVHNARKLVERTVVVPVVDTLERTRRLLSKMDCTPVYQSFQMVQERACYESAESAALIGVCYQFLGFAALVLFLILFCAWQTLMSNRRRRKRWGTRDGSMPPLCEGTISSHRDASGDGSRRYKRLWVRRTRGGGPANSENASGTTAVTVDPEGSSQYLKGTPASSSLKRGTSGWKRSIQDGGKKTRIEEAATEHETCTSQPGHASSHCAKRISTLLPISGEQEARVDGSMWAFFENEKDP
uniref:EF-hand domain-containing protein 1, related n=1 Tax=Neospora caninum (strain Liverpool) TaxID=572307 RepID=A0A0F7UCV2_NEOCL|nr:TPA: EF-hand domain-containing protein 1, related [Neospora caninum Liverpool]